MVPRREDPSRKEGAIETEGGDGRAQSGTRGAMDHPDSDQGLMMASFSYFPHFGLTIADFKPELPVSGTSSDFPGVWVADSIEKERETRKGV